MQAVLYRIPGRASEAEEAQAEDGAEAEGSGEGGVRVGARMAVKDKRDIVYATHRDILKARRLHQASAYVRTRADGRVDIVCYTEEGTCQAIAVLSRSVARLLARRINQCLDDTK